LTAWPTPLARASGLHLATQGAHLPGHDHHSLRIERHQQLGAGDVRIELPCLVLRPDHHRHPIMELRDRLVRRGRDDRIGLHALPAFPIPPPFPQAGEREDALVFQANAPPGPVPLGAGPLVEGVDRNQAPAGREASRKDRWEATVSERALMRWVPNFRSLAQHGTRPQRARTHSRSADAGGRSARGRSVANRHSE